MKCTSFSDLLLITRGRLYTFFVIFLGLFCSEAYCQTADLSLLLTSNLDSFTLYSYVTFTATLTNTGPAVAENINISMPIPSGLAYSSKTESQGSYNLYYQVWNAGNLNPGNSATLQITLFTLSPNTITTYAQVQSVSTTDPDSQPNNGLPPVPLQDDEAAKSIFYKSGSGGSSGGGGTANDSIDLEVIETITTQNVNVGGTASFVIKCKNNGPGAASGVKVKDMLPSGLIYASHNSPNGTYTPATGEWNLGNITAGSERTLTLNATVNAPGPLKNVVQVIAANEPDIDSQPNNDNGTESEDDEDFSIVNGQQVDLSLDVSLPANQATQVNLNENVTFIITLQNAGPSTSTNTKIKAFIPVGMQYVSSTSSIGVWDALTQVWVLTSTPDQNGNKPGFDIAPGVTHTMNLTLKAVQSGNITFNAEVRVSNQPDIDSTPNNGVSGEDDIDNQVISVGNTSPVADLSITMTASQSTASTGSNVTFYITAINSGPYNASGVTVKDILPAGLALNSASATVGSYLNNIWTIGTLNTNTNVVLTLQCTVTDISAPIINFAQIQSSSLSDPDSSPGNDTNNTVNEDDEATFTISPVGSGGMDLSISFSANNSILPIYQHVIFTVVVQNTSAANASNVSVKYALPSSGMAYSSSTATVGSYQSWTGIWTIGNLAGGSSATLNVDLFVLNSSPLTQFVQIWTASPTDLDSTPGNDTNNTANEDDEATLTVPYTGPQPKYIDLSLTQTATPGQVSEGTAIAYSLTVQNSGDTIAYNVTVRDILPSGINFDNAVTASGSYNNTNGIWTIGSISPGSSKNLILNVTAGNITSPVINFAQIQSAAGVGDDSTPGNDTNNTPNEDDEAATTITPVGSATGPDLELSMTAAPAQFNIYNNLSFNLTINNTGTQTASNIKVNFPLPATTAFVSKTQTIGNYDAWTRDWTIPALAPGSSASMTLTVFTLSNAAPVIAFAQVTQQSPEDNDSSPNNAVSPNAEEDDEVVFSVSSAQQLMSLVPDQKVPIVIEGIYPNPAEDRTEINIASMVNESISLEIYNIAGQLVRFVDTDIVVGLNPITLDVYDLKPGMYYIIMKDHFLKGKPSRFIKL